MTKPGVRQTVKSASRVCEHAPIAPLAQGGDIAALGEGSKSLSVTACDAAGNTTDVTTP